MLEAMKLSEKFARQESEEARLARIARRRIREDRADSIRRFFQIEIPRKATAAALADLPHLCDLCDRRFSLPMHLGRHKKSKHKPFALA